MTDNEKIANLPEPYATIYLEVFKQHMALTKIVVNADLSADAKSKLLLHLDEALKHWRTVIGYIQDDIK